MRTRSRKTAYGNLGLRSGKQRTSPFKSNRRSPLNAVSLLVESSVVTVIPFVPISNNGLLIHVEEAVWSFAGETHIGSNTTVRVFHGQRWQSPPFDRSTGTIIKFAFQQCCCIAHVTNLRIKMALLLKALKVGAANDALSIDQYKDMARGPVKVDRNGELGRYVGDGSTDFSKAIFFRFV